MFYNLGPGLGLYCLQRLPEDNIAGKELEKRFFYFIK